MNNFPNFDQFKEEIFDRINEKERNDLFYWSCFDESTWEEVNPPEFLPNFKEGEKRVLSIFKKSKSFKELIKKDQNFCKKFIWSEVLLNYLIASQIENEMKRNEFKGEISKEDIKKFIFPDIIVKVQFQKKIPIEIKRTISAANLVGRVKEEVIEGIKKYNKNQKETEKRFENFLLLLIFPVLRKENSVRINQLVEGYYIYEELIRKETAINCKVLCHCVTEKWNEQLSKNFSLEKLGKRIFEQISKFCGK